MASVLFFLVVRSLLKPFARLLPMITSQWSYRVLTKRLSFPTGRRARRACSGKGVALLFFPLPIYLLFSDFRVCALALAMLVVHAMSCVFAESTSRLVCAVERAKSLVDLASTQAWRAWQAWEKVEVVQSSTGSVPRIMGARSAAKQQTEPSLILAQNIP